jgi:hypothetical protein
LYGCLRSALFFYLKLLGDLEANGFVINPYDPCVANKMVNAKQFTITWHVDDLNFSHEDQNEVTKIIKWLKEIYGDDMRVSREKKHDYLGMDLDFTVAGIVLSLSACRAEGSCRPSSLSCSFVPALAAISFFVFCRVLSVGPLEVSGCIRE